MTIKKSTLMVIFWFTFAACLLTVGFWIYLLKNPRITETQNPEQTQENKKVEEKKEEPVVKKIFDANLLGWEQATDTAIWQKRDSCGSVVFKNKMWMVGGLDGTKSLIAKGSVEYWKSEYFSDVWSSENGKDWKLVKDNAPWGERRSMQLVVFKDKMWLMGGWGPEIGLKNDIWYSSDGVRWILATSSAAWPAIEGHQVVVYKDKMWLMGGVQYDKRKTSNSVWYTEDGVNWKLATSKAPWSSRWDHSVTVYKDKMWLMGGMDLNDKIYNDVWYSQDGVNWEMVVNNAPWQKRQGHDAVEYEGKLWIIGRFNDIFNKGSNDVWYSEDGVDWQKTQTDPDWLGREDANMLVYKDKMWIFGGMDSEWQWVNDIWYSIGAK